MNVLTIAHVLVLIKDMDDDLKHIINKEISSVQQLNEEMKTTIEKADGKLEETARKIDEHFQNVFVEVSNEIITNIYQTTIRSFLKRPTMDLLLPIEISK